MSFTPDLKYTNDHEWLRVTAATAQIGITQFAVEQLGDITLIDLPKVGDALTKGERFGTVESVKSVSDLYAPVSGKVAKINPALVAAPELVNSDPYAAGWMVEIEGFSGADIEALLDPTAYGKLVANQ
ncbi:MAG: glycine cleavage system protein GcvH [Myxococcales bacterium]|nr:glycine cleavage system protein GcvH [Myxococcales bacterium]